MAKTKPWLKMWVESLDDPKMLRLTMAEEASWWRLLRLAQRCDAGGSLITSSGSPLTTNEIATCLHITSPDDMAAFLSMLKRMEIEHSLYWNNETLHIVHFVERQQMVPSETPEAVRERVKLFRERHHVTVNPLPVTRPAVTSLSSPLEPPISNKEGEVEEEGEVEQRRYVTEEKTLQPSLGNEKDVTTKKERESKGIFANVYLTIEEYEKLITKFSQAGADDRIENLSEYIKSHGAEKKYKDHYATILAWERRDAKGVRHDTGTSPLGSARPDGSHQRSVAQAHTTGEYERSAENWRKRQGGEG